MLKQVSSAMMMAILALSLGACNKKEEAATDAPATTDTTTEAAPATDAPAEGSGH